MYQYYSLCYFLLGRWYTKVARKDSLALKLAQRPDRKELIEKNILPSMTDQERMDIRERLIVELNRKLSLRPSSEELIDKNILKTQSEEEIRLEKEQKKATLDRKVSNLFPPLNMGTFVYIVYHLFTLPFLFLSLFIPFNAFPFLASTVEL